MLAIYELQRHIHATITGYIQDFAAGGGWLAFAALLPMGIVFGALHALTPGHSKAVLAAYVAGSPVGIGRALLTSLALSFTHVTMAVLIAVLSLPLVSVALGSIGRAPALETLSRGLLIAVGLWMIWRSLNGGGPHRHEGQAVGFFAGLIPCPLTLFVMTLAMSRGAAEAGIAFAGAMMGGVALTLGAVALLVVGLRVQIGRALVAYPRRFELASRGLEGAAGLALVALAGVEMLGR